MGAVRLLVNDLVFDLADFDALGARGDVERGERVEVVGAHGRQVEDHDGDAVVLAQTQDARHFGFAVGDALVAARDGVDAL